MSKFGGIDLLALIQGLFYFATGVWPILHMRSFLAVTGPKTDLWLVKTVGAMIAVVGAVMFWAGLEGAVTPQIVGLAVASAASLTIVDVNYVSKGTIDKIYLLDAAVETVLIVAWLTLWFLP